MKRIQLPAGVGANRDREAFADLKSHSLKYCLLIYYEKKYHYLIKDTVYKTSERTLTE